MVQPAARALLKVPASWWLWRGRQEDIER
jgi:hypothetical protein